MMRADVKRLNENGQRVWLDRQGEPINVDRAWQKHDKRIALSRRQQAMLAAAGMDGPEARWYVLRVENGTDKAVDKALEDANVERWMAEVKVVPPKHRGRNGKRPEPFMTVALPGYIFVRVVSCAVTWAGLRTVKGVVDVIGGGDNPNPVKDKEVVKLQVAIQKDPKAIKLLTNALTVGDTVRIVDGPFASFEAIVLMLGDAARIKVEASIFGRATDIELDLAQVKKVD